jgi:hypothetical protein
MREILFYFFYFFYFFFTQMKGDFILFFGTRRADPTALKEDKITTTATQFWNESPEPSSRFGIIGQSWKKAAPWNMLLFSNTIWLNEWFYTGGHYMVHGPWCKLLILLVPMFCMLFMVPCLPFQMWCNQICLISIKINNPYVILETHICIYMYICK